MNNITDLEKLMFSLNTFLSEDQVVELIEAFKLFDGDSDGSITPDELGDVMRSLGNDATEDDILEMMEEFDEDKNGTIELDEFVHLISRKMKEMDSQQDLKGAFRLIDQDRDGFITASDLRKVVHQLGDLLPGCDIQDMMRVADKDNDGKIDFREFIKLANGTMR